VSAVATLEAEARDRRWAVPVTAVGALLPLAGAIAAQVVASHQPRNTPAALLFLNGKAAALNVTSAVISVGYLLVGPAVLALFRAVRRRRPEMPSALLWLPLVGAVTVAVGGLGGQVALGLAAGKFATHGGQTYQQAHDLVGGGARTAFGILQLFGSLAVAAAVVLAAIHGMRVGLLPRVLGYVGVFAGLLTVLPFLPVPVVLCFWLAALAALWAQRWPAGLPPAWTTGEAVPWPSPPRGRSAGRGAARGAPSARSGEPAPEASRPAAPAPAADAPEPARAVAARSGAAKRKRKRRR
jgi:hypothetical protein